MAWGLEARVPFLDKAFLEVAMNIDPKEKMFSKGAERVYDQDGCEKMEKVKCRQFLSALGLTSSALSMSFARRLISRPTAK
jgi:asparagine synthetase B (glutamine-hydrolysing)